LRLLPVHPAVVQDDEALPQFTLCAADQNPVPTVAQAFASVHDAVLADGQAVWT
jgi:hypothetical protein